MIQKLITAAVFVVLINDALAQKTSRMDEKLVKLKGRQAEMHYLQHGKGDTTLLLLHGWCINSTYWREQIAWFANDYAVYAPDLPGFGKSKASRDQWTIEEYAKDIAAFIDELNLKNVVIVGHSMSGDIMLEVALNNKEAVIGLVGIDNYKFIDVAFTPGQAEEMEGFFKMLEADFKIYAPQYSENMLFVAGTPDEVRERVKKDIANTEPFTGYNSLMNMMQFSEGIPAKLEALHLKLHLINSDASPTNEEGLRKHCKQGYQLVSIGTTGHYPMNEKPAAFNKLLRDILSSM